MPAVIGSELGCVLFGPSVAANVESANCRVVARARGSLAGVIGDDDELGEYILWSVSKTHKVDECPVPALVFFPFLCSSSTLPFTVSPWLISVIALVPTRLVRLETYLYTNMHTLSALFLLLALFTRLVHTSDLNKSPPLVERAPENETLQHRAIDDDALRGLVEIRAPSDVDLISRSPTPVAAAEPEPPYDSDPIPAPRAAAEPEPEPFTLADDSPWRDYEGAEVLQARDACPACVHIARAMFSALVADTLCPRNPLPSAGVCGCAGQTLCSA